MDLKGLVGRGTLQLVVGEKQSPVLSPGLLLVENCFHWTNNMGKHSHASGFPGRQ